MVEKERKRKRPSEGAQKPSKRRSVDHNGKEIQVTVNHGSGQLCPVVGGFYYLRSRKQGTN